MNVHVRHDLRVGSPVVLDVPAPTPPFTAVFEDDGRTGYFYAMDESLEGPQIVDALLVYDVEAFGEGEHALEATVAWSDDCTRVVLMLDGEPHAEFDFLRRRGACRSAWPPVEDASGWLREPLDAPPPAHPGNDAARAH
jgi:hypothetical protein